MAHRGTRRPKLSALLKLKIDGRPLRVIAAETGLSKATLSRVQNGMHVDIVSFLKILDYLKPYDLHELIEIAKRDFKVR